MYVRSLFIADRRNLKDVGAAPYLNITVVVGCGLINVCRTNSRACSQPPIAEAHGLQNSIIAFIWDLTSCFPLLGVGAPVLDIFKYCKVLLT